MIVTNRLMQLPTPQDRAIAALREAEVHVLEALELLTQVALMMTGEAGINAAMINLKIELRAYQAAITAAREAGAQLDLDEIAAATLNDLLPARRNAR